MALAETATDLDLIEKVHDLEPLIRAHTQQGERERRLSDPVAEAFVEAGFFRMLRPESLNGLGLDPTSAYRVVEEIARIDGSAGWNVQVSNISELYRGFFPDSAVQEVFAAADSVIVGAFNPHRKAVAVEGGYRLSGTSGFNSNCHHGSWNIGLANIFDGEKVRSDDEGNPLSFITLVRASDTEIVQNWNTLGMCGTGSHDVKIDDVFVPEHRVTPLVPPDPAADAYTRTSNWVLAGCLASVALGIARAAIDDLVELGVKVPAYTENTLRDRPMVQNRLARAEGKASAAREFMHATFDEAWRTAIEAPGFPMEMKARCQLAATHAVLTAAEVVDLVHSCVGASGIRNEQNFQRYFRDAHVITQHAFVCENRLDGVGQIMFGMEPDWPFFQF